MVWTWPVRSGVWTCWYWMRPTDSWRWASRPGEERERERENHSLRSLFDEFQFFLFFPFLNGAGLLSLNTILGYLPKQRRTGLFSATQTQELEKLVRAGLRNPVRITVKEKGVAATATQKTPSRLSNYYTVSPPHLAHLAHLLQLAWL